MGRAQGITHATGAKGTSVLALAPTRRPERAPAPALSCEYPIPTSHLRYATGSLLVLAGPSGVGKSTFGNRLLPKGSILSSDHMRQLISGDAGDMAASGQAFQLLHEVTSRRLAAGRTVIVDSTALSVSARQELVAIAQSQGAPVHLLLLEGSRELCLDGQRNRDRKVPVEAVERHLAQQEELIRAIEARQMRAEGFSSVLRLGRRASAAVEDISFY